MVAVQHDAMKGLIAELQSEMIVMHESAGFGRLRAICKTRPVTLCVSHSHATGRARRLLCSRCNIMLGLAQDEPERLDAGGAYLQSSKEPSGRSEQGEFGERRPQSSVPKMRLQPVARYPAGKT